MEDVTGWYCTSIRKEVYEVEKTGQLSQRFIQWQKNRLGKIVIQEDRSSNPNHKKSDGTYEIILVKLHSPLVYFEKQEDLVDYLLTFDELEQNYEYVGVIYTPYIPLSVVSVCNSNATSYSISFNKIQYVDSGWSINSASDSNGSI
jgi:hypothetical protein